MKIAAVSYRVPSTKVSNDDVIEHIARSNPNVTAARKERYLSAVRQLFNACGAHSRHWIATENDRPLDLILGAMDDALEQADMRANDIDLVIYCGVGRGFIEPANAYFYAKAKKMSKANCFDITDACMSWIRALHMSYMLLKAGYFRRAMIINGEFHFGIHDNWAMRDLRSLEHTFPMYTIGEAATATILVPSNEEWTFDYASQPELADLCTIPLPGYKDFAEPSKRIGLNGIGRFVSFGREILNHGSKITADLIRNSIEDLSSKAWYFPHAPSTTVYESVFKKLKAPTEKLFLDVFPRFGNIVSASIPVGLSLAREQARLNRGDPIALVPASAGMVASVVQFNF